MADDSALAVAADTAERDRLLALLREHLTLSVSIEQMSFSETKVLTVMLDFDGEPIATDFVSL